MKNQKLLKLVVLAMLIAIGVVISPLLRVEGMCPMAHLINIVCAVFLGPWYALLCAVIIGVLRMIFMGIPPLALTGAVFGAFLSGVFYRLSKGEIIFAVLGEVVGTGLIGSVVSYPVMTFLWGKTGLTPFFYVPSFICGTLIGGSLAFLFLRQLIKLNLLVSIQEKLGSKIYKSKNTPLVNSFGLCSIGIIAYLAILVFVKYILKLEGITVILIPACVLSLFVICACVYFFKNHDNTSKK